MILGKSSNSLFPLIHECGSVSQSIKCINVVYLTFEAKWMKQYDGYLLKRGGGGGGG